MKLLHSAFKPTLAAISLQIISAAALADQGPLKSDAKDGAGKEKWILLEEFNAADADKDGALSKDELRKQADKAFDMMDGNKDGIASKEEFQKAPPAFIGGSLASKDPKAADFFVSRLFDSIDTAHEGKISKEQLRAAFVAEFQALDSDKNGKLSADEYLIFRIKKPVQ